MQNLTLKTLKDALAKIPATYDDCPVKVWLPGSTITLCGTPTYSAAKQAALIEGNVDPGSALGG